MAISQERAERIARSHACEGCREYSWRKVAVKPSTTSLQEALGVMWSATLLCGVCGLEQELGIDAEGEVVFVG